MMRLQRVGRTHEPSFRLVLTDSKNSTKSGRFKEILGSYDPRKSADVLDEKRIKYWLSQGVTPTATVNNLLVNHKIIAGPKINVSAKSKKAPKAEIPKVEEAAPGAIVEETPQPSQEATVGEATPIEASTKSAE